MILCDQKATIDSYVIATKIKQIHVWEPANASSCFTGNTTLRTGVPPSIQK